MGDSKRPLLDPGFIPASLWEPKSEVLSLPPSLARAYEKLIDRHSLRTLSQSRDPNSGPVGGPSQEHTNEHFAQAFDGSSARVQLVLLDPKQVATVSSNALLGSLAGGSVCLTDAPCGAGAASLALLATIAELREQRVVPRLPLDVLLVGAELSAPARAYALAMLTELRPSLEAQAIFVKEDFLHWDVTDQLSNTSLIIRTTIASASATKRLLVVANFNAFLQRHEKRSLAEPQIGELFRHAFGANCVAIWIEPKMNTVTETGGLFQWLKKLVDTTWRRFARRQSDAAVGASFPACAVRFRLPLSPNRTCRVGFAVMPIELYRADG
jgi:hypothetical protein